MTIECAICWATIKRDCKLVQGGHQVGAAKLKRLPLGVYTSFTREQPSVLLLFWCCVIGFVGVFALVPRDLVSRAIASSDLSKINSANQLGSRPLFYAEPENRRAVRATLLQWPFGCPEGLSVFRQLAIRHNPLASSKYCWFLPYPRQNMLLNTVQLCRTQPIPRRLL